MRASVILATKDRGLAIEPTLEALLCQDFSDFEVVIVDNMSCDEDAARLKSWAAREPGRLRYVHEPNIGLSNARNAGIRESRGELLLFLDDDAVPPTHWISALVGAFDEHPKAWALGGKVVSRFTTPAPEWLTEQQHHFLSAFDRGNEIAPLRFDDYPRGANMAFRREAFDRLGCFLDCLGRKGDSLLSYEEIELGYRIERAGHGLLYVPNADIEHLIRGDRLSPGWFEQRCYWQGRSEAIFERIHHGRFYMLSRLPYRLLRSIVSRNRYGCMHHRGLVSGTLRTLLRTRFE